MLAFLFLLLTVSGGVLSSRCKAGCNGDPNASYNECPSSCPPTCAEPDMAGKMCIMMCDPSKCVCNDGYILTKKGGKCVKPDQCPGGSPQCGANKTYVDCFVGCPPSYCPVDDSRAMIACAIAYPCPPGCACNEGYLMLSYEDPKCILSSECPPVNCTRPHEVWDPNPSNCNLERCEDIGQHCSDSSSGPPKCVCEPGYYRNQSDICVPASECNTECNGDPNAIPNSCPSYCPPTCKDRNPVCIESCAPPGCSCKPGYILSRKGGVCVKSEDCGPYEQCKGDRNATLTQCPSPCPATCDSPDTDKPCIAICLPDDCECDQGYLLNGDGKCVKPEDCPGGSPSCGANKTYVNCKVGCPTNYCPTSDSRAQVACSPPYPCPPGCVCDSGYLMLSYGDQTCVLASECPPVNCTRPNEVWDPKPSNCYSERCEDMYTKCVNNYPSPPRCVCKPGHYRNQDDVCVPASECPLNCGLNEVAVKCRTICPPQHCEISYTDYGCKEYEGICEPGCDCKPNYLRNGSGICILNDDCPYPTSPICGVNEIARDCKKICPPQTCRGRLALFKCAANIPCEPGCDCVPNYLRNDQGVCVRADTCDSQPTCSVPVNCRRTCASPNPPDCPYNPAETNMDGCECQEGYILSEVEGKCIRIEDCPSDQPCNGDPNARPKQCPLPCPSTCEAPNAVDCKRMCDPIACECKSGYILDNKSGLCVLPDKCPGGNPCGPNEDFRECKYNCPENYCPEDEDSASIVCDPPRRCLSGCACKLNYRRLSRDNDTCIVASDCPPVDCTRPNEIWSGCPSDCFSGTCEDKEYQDVVCNTFVLNCQPKCICKRDTFRNANGTCVPVSECPCTIPDEYKRTCASPNPDSPYPPSNFNIDGCECKKGYVLTKLGGKCIKRKQCPEC